MAFVQQFFAIIYTETIAQLNADLSEDAKEALGNKLTPDMDMEAARAVILEYIPQETFDRKLKEITQEQFKDYLDTVYPTLAAETKEKLDTFLAGLPKPA